MVQGIICREAVLQDADAVMQVGDQLFDFPVNHQWFADCINDPRHHLILACYQHQVIGFTSAFHYSHPDKALTMQVTEVAVLKQYRNQGVGCELVLAVKQLASALGCRKMWLLTEADNTQAMHAYQHAGGRRLNTDVAVIEFETNELIRN
ncbi:GNAT family N-acetyltransferase [Neptunicella marina]|uniref:GNAT family N-acetyltransferase n=1 Tax=Neptunicella marina TaxID=2125989 RepID=A0A8J6M0A4_9ALTE|nr:GNAT family N-acetyltransferase [Neptunicella marina]MBC3767060.1 GNAT family N-acetyltransferase [Neptunicella marina]